MVKRYEQWQGFASSGMEEAEDGTYVLHSEYAAVAERCERLELIMRSVVDDCRRGADERGMTPSGVQDIAVRLEKELPQQDKSHDR